MNDDDSLAARLLFDREVSPDILAEWTIQAALPKAQNDLRRAAALLVRAGGEWLGLPASIVETALPVGPVHSVPYLSSMVCLGLANVDGELLPCVSLVALTGAEPGPDPVRPRLIAVSLATGRFVLLVDEAAGTCGYDPDTLTSPPDTVARSPHPIARAVALLEGRSAAIADEESLGQALLRSLRP